MIGRKITRPVAQAFTAAICALLLLLACSTPTYSQTVVATVGVGFTPYAMATNPVTDQTYVTNYGSASVTVIDGATNSTTIVTVGVSPTGVAVNTVTNKIYVANKGSNNVTVIDGATNSTTTIGVGTQPQAVAVNPITNKIYVANNLSASVTVIDGGTNATTIVAVGTNPIGIAVNPVTNKIYVANQKSNNVTVIDGATNSTNTLAVGSSPHAVAVNPVTDTIYVTNENSNNVTVINGAINSTTTVDAGTDPVSIAINVVTDTIYVTNNQSANVTVINGATNGASTVSAGTNPRGIAVNPATNQIYVVNFGSGNVTVIDGTLNTTQTLSAGTNPYRVAANPVTGRIYVANNGGANVTVIDGSTNRTVTFAVGKTPIAAAVNPVTNEIYLANFLGNTVTIIDGATNSTSTILAGNGPNSVALNPVTNMIYVSDSGNGNNNKVTVIDGSTNKKIATVMVGEFPLSVAVNPVTNEVYVANRLSTNVTIIDGTTYNTTTIVVPNCPQIAWLTVNTITNKIYGIDSTANCLAVIDGFSKTATTVPVGNTPGGVAVNTVTNRVYVANDGDGTVTVVDGATNAVLATVPVPEHPAALAVNGFTNKIYVAHSGTVKTVTVINGATNSTIDVSINGPSEELAVNTASNQIYVTTGANVVVIDGATNATTPVKIQSLSGSAVVAVNPVTGNVYVVNYYGGKATVLTPQHVQSIPLTTTIDPLDGNMTGNTTPTFTFTATSSFFPTAPPLDGLYFQFDTWQGPWVPATPTGGGNFMGTASQPLSYGIHILYAYATDGQDASSVMTSTGGGSSPLVGAVSAYLFLVTSPPLVSISVTPANPTIGLSFTQQFTATGTYEDGSMHDLTDAVTWTSSNTSVATITGGGLATGVGVGASQITAALDNISGSTVLTVEGPGVTLMPSNLNFGDQKLNTTGPPQTSTLINTGLGILTISSITISGDFAQTNTCGSTVQPGANCTISVTFTPTMEGPRNGGVTITDDANPGTQTVSLTGTGLAPLVTLSPSSLNFGDQMVGTMSQPQAVTLTNTGNANLRISSISISGLEFSETNTCKTNMGPGTSCTINVVFAPTSKGQASASLVVKDNAGSGKQQVPLSGNGT